MNWMPCWKMNSKDNEERERETETETERHVTDAKWLGIVARLSVVGKWITNDATAIGVCVCVHLIISH